MTRSKVFNRTVWTSVVFGIMVWPLSGSASLIRNHFPDEPSLRESAGIEWLMVSTSADPGTAGALLLAAGKGGGSGGNGGGNGGNGGNGGKGGNGGNGGRGHGDGSGAAPGDGTGLGNGPGNGNHEPGTGDRPGSKIRIHEPGTGLSG